MKRFKVDVVLFSIVILFMIAGFMLFPQSGLNAAIQGIHIWWDVLFPALFPFIVISEVLLGFGIVHFVGALFDPMMRPVFRVPGSGGFVMAMGFASGYPVGARLTAQLCEQKLLNRDEAERLVSFTSTSDPIFLIGAVSIGFFHDAGLATILAFAHYGGGVIIGFLMRYHGKSLPAVPKQTKTVRSSLWVQALREMHKARLIDGRPIGLLLRQAIQSSLQLVFVIGGLVVLFAVVMEFMQRIGLMLVLYSIVGLILQLFQIPFELSTAVINGWFEVTLGAKLAGEAGDGIALIHKVSIAAFILSWSGLCVHAQILSILNQTNVRYRPFFMARLAHGFVAAILVYVLWRPVAHLKEHFPTALPSYLPFGADSPSLFAWYAYSAIFIFVLTCLTIIILFVAYKLAKWIIR